MCVHSTVNYCQGLLASIASRLGLHIGVGYYLHIGDEPYSQSQNELQMREHHDCMHANFK